MEGWLRAVLAFTVCALARGQSTHSEHGKYWISAPTTVSPYTNYTLTVQILDAPAHSPVHVLAELEHLVIWANREPVVTSVASASDDLRAGELGTFTFYVPALPQTTGYPITNNNYVLHVRGTGALQLEERRTLSVQHKVSSVYIETDRNVYQPGQIINFATFSLRDSDLKPFTQSTYDITLQVGQVKMQHWTSDPSYPVSSFSYQLDTHPPLGTWIITTTSAETGTAQYQFQVQEKYEDPLFDLKVHIPETLNSSTSLTGYVEASYPFGVNVKGIAEVSIRGGIKQTLQLDRNASFMFSYNNLPYSNTIINVKVTEDTTGRVATKDASINIHERDVKIEIAEKTPAVMWPGLPFTAYVKISDNADQPLDIPADSVFRTVYVYGVGHYTRPATDNRFRVSAFTGSYPILSRKLTLSDSGEFSLDLDVPEDVDRIDLIVTFQGIQKSISLRSVQSRTHSYLQVTAVGDIPAVDSKHPSHAIFKVTSNKQIPNLNVQLLSRGQVVKAFQPSLTHKTHTGDVFNAQFQLELTWEMTPVTQMIVYYIDHNDATTQNELVADSLALNVEGLARNEIHLTSNGTRVEPGQLIKLHVKAAPNSMVGVIVYKKDVMQESVTVDKIKSMVLSQAPGPKPATGSAYKATSSEETSGAFTGAGMFTVDGNTYCPASQFMCRDGRCIPAQYECNGGNDCGDNSDEAHCGGVIRNGRDTHKIEAFLAAAKMAKVRRFAQDHVTPQISLGGAQTIFFDTDATAADGTANFLVVLPPDTITTWAATAFAFDSEGQVGALDQPLLIQATREVYIDVSGAKHAVVGEHIVIRADVRNTRATNAQVDITIKAPSWIRNWNVQSVLANGATQSGPVKRTVTVPAKGSASVYFPIVASYQENGSGGDFNILAVEAVSGTSRHEVDFSYTVAPEGVKQTYTESQLIAVNGAATHRLSLASPAKAVQGEESYVVSITDQVDAVPLRSSIAGWDVTEEGAGPDALLHLAMPVLMAMSHKDQLDHLKPRMERAYQRLMAYFQIGRFVEYSMGPTTEEFTLNTLKTLSEASQFIHVDESTVTGLINQLNAYSLEPLQGIAVLAYRDTMIGRNSGYQSMVDSILNTSRRANEQNMNYAHYSYTQLSDPLFASRAAWLATLLGYSPARYVQEVMTHAITDLTTGEIHWQTPHNDTLQYFGDWKSGQRVPRVDDVTVSSYMLMTLLRAGQNSQAEGIAKWLLRQRDIRGKFRSAYDTVIATEALSAYDAYLKAHATPSTVTATSTRLRALGFSTLPVWDTLTDSGPYNVSVDGTGTVYAQTEVTYYMKDNLGDPAFEVVPVVLDETLEHFNLMVCSRWLLNEPSGPVVQDVELPTGFYADAADANNQGNVWGSIQRNDTHVTVYFQKVADQSSCYTLHVNRKHPVAKTAPAYITTRVYKEPENQDIVSYQPRRLKESSVCDVCANCCPATILFDLSVN